MTPQTEPPSILHPIDTARGTRRRRTRACVVIACAGALCASVAAAKKPRPPRPASVPSTAQILAPSIATVPDRLPSDQQVWRCGSSYAAHPCADASVKPLDVADARSDEQRRQSDELLARDKRLAAWYEAGRREREGVASAPSPGRRASGVIDCAPSATMTCVPRKPRTRVVSVPGASTALTTKTKN